MNERQTADFWDHLAAAAYDAWKRSMADLPMAQQWTSWTQLSKRLKTAWVASVKQVVALSVEADVREPFLQEQE